MASRAEAGLDVHAVRPVAVLAKVAAQFVDALLVARGGRSSGVAYDGLFVGVSETGGGGLGWRFRACAGAAEGWRCELQLRLEFLGKDEVAADLRADREGAGAGDGESVAVVEGLGAVVVVVGTEEQAFRTEGAGFFDGRAEQGLAGADAGLADDFGFGGAEAREEVDALQLGIGGEGVEVGELGSDEHGVADRDVLAGDRERDPGAGFREVGSVGGGRVLVGAEVDEVGGGEHPGVGLEESGSADEGEGGSVGCSGRAEGDGLGRGLGGSGVGGSDFDGVNGHGGSR